METIKRINPAGSWLNGFPIGNGRLAAMIWGEESTDILTLNHEWLWRGVNRGRKVVPAAEHLEFVRDLLRRGEFFRATVYANLYYAGEGYFSGGPNRVDPYQPAGELRFAFSGIESFEGRELDLEHGVAAAWRKAVGSRVKSEFLASCESNLIMASWQSEDGEHFDGILSLGRCADDHACCSHSVRENRLVLDCSFEGGLQHRVTADIQTDGTVCCEPGGVRVRNASSLFCVVDIATSVKGIEEELASHPFLISDFSKRAEFHRREFALKMNLVSFELAEETELCHQSFDERLEHVRKGGRDNGISALYYHFGRYLLLSSSLLGDLPANLQGKWNDKVDPPWECDYHFDINLEMNYWMAEPCGMTECAEKLFAFVESFYESGEECARELYGCRGICLPIQTDAWGLSTPESFGWAAWVGAAAWMARHFWQHYEFSGDRVFLKERAYRYFKAVAQFYEDYLVEDETGTFQIMPSQSPENRFKGSGELPVGICISSAMDVQLCFDALGYAIDAAELLGVDGDSAERWNDLRSRLPGFPIGRDGRLLEWNDEKCEVREELGHRHVSHLYGAYPSELFTGETRREQFEAAEKSLAFRLEHGSGHTGWSLAWVACLQARFGDRAEFHAHYTSLIRDFASDTLLNLHIPAWFQIDGNLGGVAAVNEALVSCTDGKIHLLRALPKEWLSGHLRGIRTPGGHTIDLEWKDGRVFGLTIKMGYSGSAVICSEDTEKRIDSRPGDIVAIW